MDYKEQWRCIRCESKYSFLRAQKEVRCVFCDEEGLNWPNMVFREELLQEDVSKPFQPSNPGMDLKHEQ